MICLQQMLNEFYMKTLENLQSGDQLTNQELYEVFGCGHSGGMRRAKKTKSLVIISSYVKSIYDEFFFCPFICVNFALSWQLTKRISLASIITCDTFAIGSSCRAHLEKNGFFFS